VQPPLDLEPLPALDANESESMIQISFRSAHAHLKSLIACVNTANKLFDRMRWVHYLVIYLEIASLRALMSWCFSLKHQAVAQTTQEAQVVTQDATTYL
jgi:hypothetical protein